MAGYRPSRRRDDDPFRHPD